MLSITLHLTIFTYYEDQLQVWLQGQNKDYHNLHLKLAGNPNSNNLKSIVKSHLNKTLQLTLNPNQIILVHPQNQLTKSTLIIPILVQIDNETAATLNSNVDHHPDQQFYPYDILPTGINQLDIKSLHASYEAIKQRLTYYSITGISYLLPNRFTAHSLSAMLSNITGDFVKYNNIRRNLGPELKLVGKDHSRRGRPVNIFTYKKPKKAMTKHVNPKTKYKEAPYRPTTVGR